MRLVSLWCSQWPSQAQSCRPPLSLLTIPDPPRCRGTTVDKLTKKQIRQRARAKARAEAARVRAARLHARAVARKNLRLRNNKRIPHRAAIIFNKNWDDPYDSRIIFRSWAKTGPKGKKKWVRVEQASWRAGSGLSGAAGRDACHRGKGWAPNGTYSFVQHNRRKAPLINGRVFELQPMACHNGTVRQMMFIHSEQNWNNTQCKNRRVTTPVVSRRRRSTTTGPGAASRWRPTTSSS